MSRLNRRVPRPSRFRLEFAVFCEANRDAYLRYAQARIEDQAEATRCVDTVLGALEAGWITVLGSECPAARVWGNLRTETGHRATGRAEKFHAVLRDDQADIMLLHHHLSLPLEQAARLMGLPNHDAHALLRGAERELSGLPDH